MKEIHNTYLLAILGLLTVIAFGIVENAFLWVCTIILFFMGLYGIAFRVEKKNEKNSIPQGNRSPDK